jgi:hypothetical protein
VLYHSIDKMKARDLLTNPDYVTRLTSEGTYELVLMATGDEELAQESASERGMERLRQGLRP